MANDQAHDTRGTSANRLAQAVGLSVAARAAVAPTSFTPMYTDNFLDGVIGTSTNKWRYSEYSNVQAVSGGQSLMLGQNRASTTTGCDGNHFWGNRQNLDEEAGLPEAIPIGNTVWMRIYHYFPSTFSFGHMYQTGIDSAEAAACGKSSDGNYSGMKWLVFAPNSGTRRIYHQLPSGRRKIEQPSTSDPENSTQRIQSEVLGKVAQSSVPVALNQWVAIQMAVKVASDNTGWIRLWNGSELIAEVLDVPTVHTPDGATSIQSWGLGDYWNGVPYTDGEEGRNALYIDEIIIASDMPGYGAPTGVDAAGNAYIDPTTRIGDF